MCASEQGRKRPAARAAFRVPASPLICAQRIYAAAAKESPKKPLATASASELNVQRRSPLKRGESVLQVEAVPRVSPVAKRSARLVSSVTTPKHLGSKLKEGFVTPVPANKLRKHFSVENFIAPALAAGRSVLPAVQAVQAVQTIQAVQAVQAAQVALATHGTHAGQGMPGDSRAPGDSRVSGGSTGPVLSAEEEAAAPKSGIQAIQAARQTFYTPQDYKLVKPLQTVFMSTGLLSKRNCHVPSVPVLPPDTPCKRPVMFDIASQTQASTTPAAVGPTDTSFSSQEESFEGIDLSFLCNSSSSEFDCPLTPTKGVFLDNERFGKRWKIDSGLGYFSRSPTDPSLFHLSSKVSEPNVFSDSQSLTILPNCTSFKESSSPSSDLLTSRFRNVELVGSGEFSEVYEVEEKDSSVKFAVKKTKFAYSGSKERSRRLEEVNILRKLGRHEHIVELLDSWEQSKYLYIQMELCDNGSLDIFLQEYGRVARLDEFRVWKVMTELSLGLLHIHDSGYIHLDLKPANIFISFKGTLKIGDFGMASVWPVPVGTEREGDREYIAPEVLSSQQYDKPADIFSLGLVILEVAANIVLPQNGLSWQKLRSGDLSDAPRLSSSKITSFASESISHEQSEHRYIGHGGLDYIVKQMLAPEPLDRPTAKQILKTKEVVWVNKVRKAGAIIYEGDYGPEMYSTNNHDANGGWNIDITNSEKKSDICENSEYMNNAPPKTPLEPIPQYYYTPFKSSQLYSPKDLSFEENQAYRYYKKPVKEDPWKQLHTTPLKQYKSFNVLSDFITEMGRILPREETGCSAKHQRQLAKAIRRCRGIGLLSTVRRHPSYIESKRRPWTDVIAAVYRKNVEEKSS
ncbi:hypothetical protein PORY_000594 [Pneumocystis oryctolagi]|uniref:Uncharacterized protein n=1 Tax=Pneumocystis oryctolagi TaxID=42067 RepID=A0ACB7CFL8_9ASCO|nr:hypothetical protein PORY_000594 [Pneumocystis oryctolagi]